MSLLGDLFSRVVGSKRNVIESGTPHYFNVFTSQNHSYEGASVNYQLARDMYRNLNNTYALSAHLLKPIIDSSVSFIGKPIIASANKRVKTALEACLENIDTRSVIRIAEREGTCFVWLQYNNSINGNIEFVVPRPEAVQHIAIDPITKNILGYIIEDTFSHYAVNGDEYQTTVKVTLTAKNIDTEYMSSDPSVNYKHDVVPNVLGFIPVVRFTNDAEPWELRGHSEIGNIEPTLKLYNDLMVDAVNAQSHNTPKIKVKTKDVKKFIENNFGVGAYERLKGGEGIDMNARDVYFLEHEGIIEDGDDVDFISPKTATGDSKQLIETAFMNTIEGAQTPEFIFGASMGASLSSVQEQRPAFMRKVSRKQEQYGASWKQLFDMCLDILGYASYAKYDKSAYKVEWSTPDFATDKEKSDTANAFMTALVKARGNGILSDSEIHATLLKVGNMELEREFAKHIVELDKTQERKVKEAEDSNAAKNDEMTDRYANEEYDNTAVEDIDKNDKSKGVTNE